MKHSRFRIALFFVASWGILTGLWFLYTVTPKISELLVGLGAALLAATGMAVVEGERFAQFAPKARWLLLFLAEPWYALEGSASIVWALVRRIAGQKSEAQLKAVKFDAGGDDDKSAARRALALCLTTIPPNFIVIGIDRDEEIMLIHQVSPTGVPWVAKQVGAQE